MSTYRAYSRDQSGTIPAYATLQGRLEANRLSVDSIKEIAADPCIRIADSAAPRAVSVLTAAIVLRSAPELLSETGQIQIVSADNCVGSAFVSLDWIRAYRAGEITATEYAKRVLETWRDTDPNTLSTGGGLPCSSP